MGVWTGSRFFIFISRFANNAVRERIFRVQYTECKSLVFVESAVLIVFSEIIFIVVVF